VPAAVQVQRRAAAGLRDDGAGSAATASTGVSTVGKTFAAMFC
jgi:hypothetical protein